MQRKGATRRKVPVGTKPGLSPEQFKFSLTEKLNSVSYYIFRRPGAKVAKIFKMDQSMAAAGFYLAPEIYVARSMFLSTIVAPLSVGVGVIYALLFAQTSVAFLMGVIGGAAFPLVLFWFGLMYPSMAASSRKKAVDQELPFVAVYLTTMVRGGIAPMTCLERLSTMKWFPAMRKEVTRILRDIQLFGMDPLSALEKNAIPHPNKAYGDFMEGYASTVRTGGDVLHYLESKTESIFDARTASIKNIAERTAMITEIFIIVAVVMGLTFYIFFSISTLMPIGGVGDIAQFTIFSFVLLPFFSVLTIYLMHSMQPKTMIRMVAPYKVFIFSIPPAIGVYFGICYWTQYSLQGQLLAIAMALLTISIPPSISYTKEIRGYGGMEDALSSFLRELTEVRKTGLSPEKCIEYAARREYGALTKTIKAIVRQISWGTPLRKVFNEISKSIKDWFTLVVLNFMVDVIDVGGGGVLTLESLARFSRFLRDIEKDLKSKIKPFMIMPYFGAIMIAASTLLTINLTISTMALVPASGNVPLIGGTQPVPIDINQIIFLFTSSLLVNSWFMGIVAGKIGDTRIAAGFRHAAILTIISYVAIAFILTNVIGVK